MTFAQFNLNPDILKAINHCGYKTPTPIQTRSIPDILMGKDLVASAQTGSGKTAAFVLPTLHRISLTKQSGKPRVLILTPTRELANQITSAVGKYGKYLRCKIANLVGGMSYHQQLRSLSGPVDFIVATPGRLLDHMENRRVDLSAIEMLVLDEADRMLDMGFIDDVRAIANATPGNRQTLLFSATINNNLSHLIRKLLKNPLRIDLSQEVVYPKQIKQQIYLVDNGPHRTKLLNHFLTNENIYKAIIFTATKISADTLAKQLCKQGFRAAPLHGDLKQGVRNRTVEQLRRGNIQYLVATDVAARGIDIQDITHVINYDMPKFFEDYVHRIGRTGRAGKSGIAISFASNHDARHIQRIERFIKQKIDLVTVPGLEPAKQMATGRNKDNAGRKKNNSGWKKDKAGWKKEAPGWKKDKAGRKKEASEWKKDKAGKRKNKTPEWKNDNRESGYADKKNKKRKYSHEKRR